MPAQGTLPVEPVGARQSIDPAAAHVAALIADTLDTNEHVRHKLVGLRQSPGSTESARARYDVGLGRLARVHGQLTRALRDVEQGGGAE